MTYTGYYTAAALREKLGNTIAANYGIILIDDARRYGDNQVDLGTHRNQVYVDSADPNVSHGWKIGDQFFDAAKTISMEFAVTFVRSTQLNVSIQSLREYTQAEKDLIRFYEQLVTLGLGGTASSFKTDQFVTDVLNPIDGTIVTGLGGIVRKNRFGSLEDSIHVP